MHGKPGILLLGCKLDRGSVLQNLGCCVHDDEGIDAALTHTWAIYCRRRARQLWFQQDGISLVETLLNARQRIGEYPLLFMMAFLKDLVMSHSDESYPTFVPIYAGSRAHFIRRRLLPTDVATLLCQCMT